MKKILFLGAIAAMLLGTTACSNDMEPEMTDGTVQFKVELPGAIESRAISDGTTAIKLETACYDADSNKLAVEPTVKTDFVNREATVTYKLVKGQKYHFAFFAHAENAPYQFDAGSKLSKCNFTVTDNYTGTACLSNAENRDAFYATLTDYEVKAEVTEVTLYRPFAQLNFGTDDLEAAAAAGITPDQTKVTVKQVATSFNLSTGKAATAGAVDATFALANLPTDTNEKIVVGEEENKKEYGKLTVENKDYAWMAMNYFLVPNNEANVEVEMTVNTNKQPVTVPVTSVPVKKNHRTNILGSLFTQEGNFKVIIDQNFDTPDYNVDANATYYDVTKDGGLETVMTLINEEQPENAVVRIANGVTVTWTTGGEHGSTPLITAENTKTKEVVLEGGEGSIFKAEGAGVGEIRSANASTILHFKNLRIQDRSVSYAEHSWEFGYLEISGPIKFTDCIIEDPLTLGNNRGFEPNYEYNYAIFDNCKLYFDKSEQTDYNKLTTSTYLMWICDGKAEFRNCDLSGFRGIKVHNQYPSGSLVDLSFNGCTFHDINEGDKAAFDFGTIQNDSKVLVKDCVFRNIAKGPYKSGQEPENVNFNFIFENNTIE